MKQPRKQQLGSSTTVGSWPRKPQNSPLLHGVACAILCTCLQWPNSIINLTEGSGWTKLPASVHPPFFGRCHVIDVSNTWNSSKLLLRRLLPVASLAHRSVIGQPCHDGDVAGVQRHVPGHGGSTAVQHFRAYPVLISEDLELELRVHDP